MQRVNKDMKPHVFKTGAISKILPRTEDGKFAKQDAGALVTKEVNTSGNTTPSAFKLLFKNVAEGKVGISPSTLQRKIQEQNNHPVPIFVKSYKPKKFKASKTKDEEAREIRNLFQLTGTRKKDSLCYDAAADDPFDVCVVDKSKNFVNQKGIKTCAQVASGTSVSSYTTYRKPDEIDVPLTGFIAAVPPYTREEAHLSRMNALKRASELDEVWDDDMLF